MIPVSEWWTEAVTTATHWETHCEWAARTGRRYRATPIACEVVEDATQVVRWALKAEFLLEDAPNLDIYGMAMQVYITLVGSAKSETIQLGNYRLNTLTHGWVYQNAGRDATVRVEATSWDKQISDAQLTVPIQIEGPAGPTIDGLLRNALPNVSVQWDVPINSRYIYPTTIDKDVWAWISGTSNTDSSFARSFAVRVFPDHLGVFHITKESNLRDDAAMWVIGGGPGQAQLSATHTVTRDGAFNAVVVSGSTDANAPQWGPLVVADQSTSSRTSIYTMPYIHGGFGLIPTYYSSNLLTDAGEGWEAGRAMLAPLLGARRTLDMGRLFDPSIRAGDVGIVDSAAGPTRVVLDTVTCDLVKHTMTCRARAEAGDPNLIATGGLGRPGGAPPDDPEPPVVGSTIYQDILDNGTYHKIETLTYDEVMALKG